MIIYPSGFPLSAAAAGEPLLHPRIGWHTHTRDSGIIVTASSETVGGPKDAPLREDTAGYWQPSALPAWWKINFGTIREINYAGIVANLGSCGASLLVETSMDNATWAALGIEVVPSDNAPLVALDEYRSARFARLSIAGTGLAPKIAVVYLGRMLAMAKPIPLGYRPITLSRVTEMHTSVSRGGQFLGQSVRSRGVEGSVNFLNLKDTWYRSEFDPFVKEARQYPYFFVWAPEAFPLEVAYVWTDSPIAPAYVQSDRVSVGWPMHGIGHE